MGTMRHFWTVSYRGRHLGSYEDGFVLGVADATDGTTAHLDRINALPFSDAVDASRDGHKDGYDHAKKNPA